MRQLALTYYIYPGAMHTRFEHSLGVMDLASRAFEILCRKHEESLRSYFAEVPELRTGTLAKARQIIRLFGLLHDIGHPAFSHAGECIIPGGRHERLSAYVLRESELGELIGRTFSDIPRLCDLLARMVNDEDIPPQLRILKQLISGQMDLDRTDYLLRDSLHCGVDYGNFDYRRLVESLTILEHPETRSLEVALEPSGLHSFEALLLARYLMNTQVYYHRLRRVYDLMLRRYLEAWGSDNYDPLASALGYDDYNLIAQMRSDADSDPTSERGKWASRILGRRHPRCFYESTDHAYAVDLEIARNVLATMQREFSAVEFILDQDARGNVHKLFVRGDAEKIDDLFVNTKSGRKRVTDQSKLLQTIPKSFWVIRIYGYFDNDDGFNQACRRAEEIHRRST